MKYLLQMELGNNIRNNFGEIMRILSTTISESFVLNPIILAINFLISAAVWAVFYFILMLSSDESGFIFLTVIFFVLFHLSDFS